MDARRNVAGHPFAAAACAAAMALLLVAPSSASAGYAAFTPAFIGPGGLPSGATVDFRARDGEVNTVTVSYEPGTAEPVVIHDATTPITEQMLVAPTCSRIDANTVRCGNADPFNVVVELGDLDDSVTWVGSATPTAPPGRNPFQANGGAGDDSILGSEAPDSLNDGAGNDVLRGLDGGDSYFDSAGNDMFVGGPGADAATDGPGNDTLDGGDGDDNFVSEKSGAVDPSTSDSFIGGDGTDSFEVSAVGGTIAADGGPGGDRWRFVPRFQFSSGGVAGTYSFAGGDGSDTTTFGPGGGCCEAQLSLTINGGGGGDSLTGGTGPDAISGGDGDDGLSGGPGPDTLDGGLGNDRLAGAEGDDTVRGSDGNDVLRGGAGSDGLFGDAGDDALDSAAITPFGPPDPSEESAPTPDNVSCGDGNDATNADPIDTVAEDCEGFTTPVDCPPDTAAGCSGDITLATAKPIPTEDRIGKKPKKKPVRLGKTKFVVPPSDEAAYPVAGLSKKGRKLLKQRGKLKIRKTVTTKTQLLTGGVSESVTETVFVIRAPR